MAMTILKQFCYSVFLIQILMYWQSAQCPSFDTWPELTCCHPESCLFLCKTKHTHWQRGCADMNRSYELIGHWLPVTSMLSLSGVSVYQCICIYIIDIVRPSSFIDIPTIAMQCSAMLSVVIMEWDAKRRPNKIKRRGRMSWTRWHCCLRSTKYRLVWWRCAAVLIQTIQALRRKVLLTKKNGCHEWWLVTLVTLNLWHVIRFVFFSINLTETKSIQIQQSQFRMTDWTVRWYVTGTGWTGGYMPPCCVNWWVTNLL